VYNEKIFPCINGVVRKKLEKLESKTLYGRPYLPIGSAMLMTADYEEEAFLIFAPIGFRPYQNIYETRNIYHAFMASLCLLKRYHNDNIQKLIFPKIDPEYFGLSSRRFAEQIYAALIDFTFMLSIPKPHFNLNDYTLYITFHKERDKEQPDYYENMEIKNYKDIRNLQLSNSNVIGNMLPEL
jgi:hypothetical protein